MQTTKTCPNCGGEGTIIKKNVQTVNGKGRIRKLVKIKVKIPAGISDNQTVVLRGEGEPGSKGGPKGDLYIVVNIKRHSIFSRNGDNVICQIPITFTQATLGADLKIPMVDGKKKAIAHSTGQFAPFPRHQPLFAARPRQSFDQQGDLSLPTPPLRSRSRWTIMSGYPTGPFRRTPEPSPDPSPPNRRGAPGGRPRALSGCRVDKAVPGEIPG